jgi:hypothetical protein
MDAHCTSSSPLSNTDKRPVKDNGPTQNNNNVMTYLDVILPWRENVCYIPHSRDLVPRNLHCGVTWVIKDAIGRAITAQQHGHEIYVSCVITSK